jgi:hypothetical protein
VKKYQVGDRVAIVSYSIMGRMVLEGWADVVAVPEPGGWHYGVTFGDDKRVLYRSIQPRAQADPEAYVQRINDSIARNP